MGQVATLGAFIPFLLKRGVPLKTYSILRTSRISFAAHLSALTMNQRIALGLLAFYWVAMIVGTHIPADYVPYVFSWMDKAVHLVIYAGLAALIVNAFGFHGSVKIGARAAIGLTVLLILHGAVDELTQSFVPGRYPSVADWVADGLGGALGVVACWWWSKKGVRGQSLRAGA